MSPSTRSPLRRLADPAWVGRAALVFVLLTLATLALVPVLVQRRVEALRVDIEASEPARTLVIRLQYDLVREMAALNELVLGGDASFAAIHAAARAEERAVFAELEPLAERLGPEVQESYVEARTLAAQWHERVADEELARRGAQGGVLGRAGREQGLFEQVLRATSAMDAAILRETARGRQRIARIERTGIALSVGLGLLALVAAGAAAVLYGRVRRFAAESEQRRLQAEEALAESARANEARVRLLRGVTHDVKNPLGAAKGYAELLAMGVRAPVQPEQLPMIEGIQRSVDGALAIIADLLDVARADSGGLTVNRVPVELGELARQATDDHRAAAEAAGHTLAYEACTEPAGVHTDPVRVRQVLENLLSNAIKYTPAPGRIVVRTELAGEGAPREGSWARVAVMDNGPGIPAERREDVFEEFMRLDERSPARGHGLGLAIARSVARLLGGDLSVEETPGGGATFLLWLPLRTPVEP